MWKEVVVAYFDVHQYETQRKQKSVKTVGLQGEI
jgi:hypothetical protein